MKYLTTFTFSGKDADKFMDGLNIMCQGVAEDKAVIRYNCPKSCASCESLCIDSWTASCSTDDSHKEMMMVKCVPSNHLFIDGVKCCISVEDMLASYFLLADSEDKWKCKNLFIEYSKERGVRSIPSNDKAITLYGFSKSSMIAFRNVIERKSELDIKVDYDTVEISYGGKTLEIYDKGELDIRTYSVKGERYFSSHKEGYYVEIAYQPAEHSTEVGVNFDEWKEQYERVIPIARKFFSSLFSELGLDKRHGLPYSLSFAGGAWIIDSVDEFDTAVKNAIGKISLGELNTENVTDFEALIWDLAERYNLKKIAYKKPAYVCLKPTIYLGSIQKA